MKLEIEKQKGFFIWVVHIARKKKKVRESSNVVFFGLTREKETSGLPGSPIGQKGQGEYEAEIYISHCNKKFYMLKK